MVKRIGVRAGAALLLALLAAARAGAQMPGEERDARGFDLAESAQEVGPGQQVGLFQGTPTFRRELVRWSEPAGQSLSLTLEYSGAVEHRRFDIRPIGGYSIGAGTFGEWSLCLNGHVLWTANLAPFHFNGELPGQPHRDSSGHVIDGCWRTCGYSACDLAYAGGASSGDVELAASGGALVQFGYPQNNPASGNPVMLPNDAALAWRASLVAPSHTGRTLTVKKPDGTTWLFSEVPLTLFWPGYYYNVYEGPRAFRLTSLSDITGGFSAQVTYAYGDSGGAKLKYLHPTSLRVRDQAGRTLDISATENSANFTAEVSVASSTSPLADYLSLSERTWRDATQTLQHTHLYYVDALSDRAGRTTRFRYEDDDRADAYPNSCGDSLQIRARRLAGVDQSEGGGTTYLYLPRPAMRPACPDLKYRYQDSAWRLAGRSSEIAPMVRRVEVRENASAPPQQTLDFAYSWNQSPAVGDPMESESYRYDTRLTFNVADPGPPIPGGVALGAKASASSFSVDFQFLKLPHQPQTHGGPSYNRWAPRLDIASTTLLSGETHILALTYDAVPSGGTDAGTLLPTSRTYRVQTGSQVAQYTTGAIYDSLARPVETTDSQGGRHRFEYFESAGLHSPWSGTGRYFVLLPSRERVESSASGALLSEAWCDREPQYGRPIASYRRLDASRVAITTYAYDPVFPWKLTHAAGPLGKSADYSYDTEQIPGTLAYAGAVGEELPARITTSVDAGHSLVRYQAFDGEGRLLREADAAGRLTIQGYDGEGRPRTLARPGDVMTGPPPPPPAGGKFKPSSTPYDLTPWPSSVITYFGGSASPGMREAFYPAMTDSVAASASLDGRGRVRLRQFLGGVPPVATAYDFDSMGRLAAVTGPEGTAARYQYDELGRMTSVTDMEGHTTTLEHHSAADLSAWGLPTPAGLAWPFLQVEILRAPGGGMTLSALDSGGRLRVSARLASSGGSALSSIAYDYDEQGNMRSMRSADGRATTWDYDMAGHARHALLPDGRLRTYVQDLCGRLVFMQDENGAAAGSWIYCRYDRIGRLLEEGTCGASSEQALQPLADQGLLPSGASWKKRLTYDSVADPNPEGVLTRAESRVGAATSDVVNYQHDSRQRVKRRDFSFWGVAPALSVQSEFDRLDRLRSVTFPDGRKVAFAYDPVLGQILSATWGARALANFTRDASGRVRHIQNGSIAEDRTYTARGRLASQLAVVRGQTRFEEVLETDPDGRTSASSVLGESRLEADRDAARRLSRIRYVEEPGAPSVAYRHDAGGEMDSVGSDLVSLRGLSAQGKLLEWDRLPSGRDILAYDAHGNRTRCIRMLGADTLCVLGYRYSVDHELLSVTSSASGRTDSVTYSYDASGGRTRRTAGGITTLEIRDESGELLAEADTTGRILRDYVRVAGWLLGILNADGSYTALVTDRAGSVRLGVDDRGAVRFQQEFLPFGEPAHAEYAERPTLGFLGREQDMETGLLYLKNRYYDPGTARFLSPDPMRGAGLPEYAYGLGDPLTYSDPDGLAPEDGEGSHQPVFSLPEIVVRAGRVLQRDALHWFVERITRLAQGGDDFRGPWRGVSPEVPVPGPANQLQHLLEGEAVRFLRQVHDGFCPECRILPSSTVHRLAVTAQGMTARAMIVHEAISLARVSAALDRAKSLTPAQKDAIRLRAGVTLLAEVTFDELGLLGLQLIPAGSQEAEILAALLEGREGISEFDDQSFEGFVPGYDDTSAAGFNPGAGAPPR